MDKSLPKKIWLSGLGAIARADREGDAWLQELMAEGEAFEQEKKTEIDQAISQMTEKAKQNHHSTKHRISDIESTFEHKVASLFGKIGFVSKGELKLLHERLANIEQQINANIKDSNNDNDPNDK